MLLAAEHGPPEVSITRNRWRPQRPLLSQSLELKELLAWIRPEYKGIDPVDRVTTSPAS
jgi:hypothetical protein